MVSADIDDCIMYSLSAVTHWAQEIAQNLYTNLATWETAFVQFNDNDENERTVRNWKVPTHCALQKVPNANGDQLIYAQDSFWVVFQACCAAKYAAAAGRITAGQLAQVVTDWNTAWSF